MGDEKDEIITAFEGLKHIPKQEQDLPGLDKHMTPRAEHTKLEAWDDEGNPYLTEYVGSGKLKGKTALITGGDSGIGRATAQMFAREGCDVTIVYLPEEEEDAQSVKKAIESEGRQCLTIAADLMKAENGEKVIKQHIEKYGKLNILVNNASKQLMEKDFASIDLDDVESTFRSNILAMFALTKYALPHLKRGSSIIQTSSVTAFKGSPALIDYATTKGAIVSFTRSLAMQLAPKGIRVNVICPGPVFTPLQPGSRPAEQMEGWEAGKVPLWGRAGQPSELGPTYVYLASPDSGLVTGAVLHVNSGSWVG